MGEHIAFLPAGEMNSALAVKAQKNGYQGCFWFHSARSLAFFRQTNQNPRLKGIDLTGIQGSTSLADTLRGAKLVVFASRSWDLRELVNLARPFMEEEAIIASAVKGFSKDSGRYITPSEVIEHWIPGSKNRVAVISGPNFAEQIARGSITGTTVAAYNQEAAKQVREVFHNESFRVDLYKGDPRDVEIIGAFKNVVGLIMGFTRTLPEYDENTGALILQKGLSEAALLCKAMGGDPMAIMELCGIGDYGLLMNIRTSRNVRAGEAFGRGEIDLDGLLNSDTTVEGVRTSEEVRQLARENRVFLPLARAVSRVLFDDIDPAIAVRTLLRHG